MNDILIKNGTLIDPANNGYSKLNLLLSNGKVEGITTEVPQAQTVIDAEGKYVTPGFIDIHMHEEQLNEEEDTLEATITEAMLRMGVTTAIGGNCGINTIEPKRYLDLVDRHGSAINMGLFVGHTRMRELAGHADKYTRIRNDELHQMERLVEENLEAGCFGVSFGIRYVPGLDKQEMVEVAKHCVGKEKLITAHVRDDAEYIFGAVDELVDVGRKLGLPIQNSHVGSMGGFGQMERLLAMLDQYRAEGVDVTSDCYPYYAFSTRIGETTYDEGFLSRYKADYSVIEICEGPYKGQKCNEAIFRELRKEAPRTLTVCHVMKSTDVDMALLHPGVMVASDGLMDHGQGHPRAAGTFPRFLCNYVKTGKISLYHAVEKMTSMQAKKLGLPQKGTLRKGADGDVVIFDLDRVQDKASFSEPIEPPQGIEYVIINGEIAVKNGEILNRTLGSSVRKFK